MMEPLNVSQELEGNDTPVNLNALQDATDSDDELDDIDVGEELHDFLTLTIKGPQLDEHTIVVLHNSGVEDMQTFLDYSQMSYPDMISSIPTKILLDLGRSMEQDIRNVKLYGEYILAHGLLDASGNINLDAVNPPTYQLYLRSRRRHAAATLQDAVADELRTRAAQKQARMTREATRRQSMALLSTTEKTSNQTPTEHIDVRDGIGPRNVTPDTPPPHAPGGSPSTGGDVFVPSTAATNVPQSATGGESMVKKLDYSANDDVEDLLFMVDPVEQDPQSPEGLDKHVMTPANGQPATDPAFSNRLQNPDTYGTKTSLKQLAMINSKIQWNGKRSSFDELKALLEGHFEG
jgi:hypothetical protein